MPENKQFYYKAVKLQCRNCGKTGEGVLKTYYSGLKKLAGFKCFYCGNEKRMVMSSQGLKNQRKFWAVEKEMDERFNYLLEKE